MWRRQLDRLNQISRRGEGEGEEVEGERGEERRRGRRQLDRLKQIRRQMCDFF